MGRYLVRLDFTIELKYEVAEAPADFVFNIHAAQTPWQSVAPELLTVPIKREATAKLVRRIEDSGRSRTTGVPSFTATVTVRFFMRSGLPSTR